MTKLTDYLEKEQQTEKPNKRLNRYIIKLLWQVIGKIDPDTVDLSFKDKEALEDLLVYDSIEEIAQKRKIPVGYFITKINYALKAVSRQIDIWEKVKGENVKLRIDKQKSR